MHVQSLRPLWKPTKRSTVNVANNPQVATAGGAAGGGAGARIIGVAESCNAKDPKCAPNSNGLYSPQQERAAAEAAAVADPDSTELMVRLANIDYAFIFVMSLAFLAFNVSFWASHSISM